MRNWICHNQCLVSQTFRRAVVINVSEVHSQILLDLQVRSILQFFKTKCLQGNCWLFRTKCIQGNYWLFRIPADPKPMPKALICLSISWGPVTNATSALLCVGRLLRWFQVMEAPASLNKPGPECTTSWGVFSRIIARADSGRHSVWRRCLID